jgi:hypothetical protein
LEIIWEPGQGIDLAAVERMKQHFPKPTERSYAAWFMSGIEYIDWLADLPVEQYDISQLEHYLFDTGGGIKSFGRYEEWVKWYQYLLPHLSTQIMEEDLMCHTLTYFFNMYPEGIVEEYPGFRDDVLNVLPYYIMSKDLYHCGDIQIENWWFDDWAGYWGNAFPATMFFCLKYLTPLEITSWVSSFGVIEAPLLKSEIDKWIIGAKKFFQYVKYVEMLPTSMEIRKQIKEDGIAGYLEAAGINWWHSFLIFGGIDLGVNKRTQLNDYLPQENIDAFLAAVRQYESNSTT